MANEPANPQLVNQIATTTDTSVVNSLTGGGAVYFGLAELPVVTSNSHPVVTRADGACWDVTAGAYVAIQNTSFGTTSVPKAGQ